MAKKQAAAQQPLLDTDSEDAKIDGIVVEVLDPAKPIVAYNPIRAAIEELTKKYGKLVFDVSTTKGLDDAKAARLAIRDPRYKIEHIRKALKAPALAYSRRIDAEAEDYTAKLMALETPIDEQIKAREKQIEDEKAAKAAREAEERRRIDQAIADLQFYVVEAAGKTIDQMQALHDELAGKDLTAEEFVARLPEAVLVRNTTVARLKGMIDAAVAAAAEAQRLAEEAERQRAAREELERQQRELERQRQELAEQQRESAVQAAATAHGVPADLLRIMAQQESAGAGGSARGLFRISEEQDDSQPFIVPRPVTDAIANGSGSIHRGSIVVSESLAQGINEIDDSAPFPSALDATDDEIERPSLAELVEVIANEFDVDDETAEQWLRAAVAEA